MSDSPSEMPAPGNPLAHYRRFESFREYEMLFDDMVSKTETIIRVFDRKLSPSWNNASRIALLRDFLSRNRMNQLMIVLHISDNLERELPRLVEFAVYFGHAMKIRQTPAMGHHIYDPFILFDASHYLHRFHHAHMRAAQGIHDMDCVQPLQERFAELWEVSTAVPFGGISGL